MKELRLQIHDPDVPQYVITMLDLFIGGVIVEVDGFGKSWNPV